MKTMLAAFMTVMVLAVAADIVLDHAGFSSREVTSGPAVRSE